MKIADFITESRVLVETRTPNQILLELNVINIPQIDTFLADIAQNLPTKETQKWFISRAKKYLINSEEDNAVITHFSGKAEPWMKQRQKEGVQLYRFNPSHDLTTKLAHVVDWVRAMNDTVTGAKASDQQSTARAKKAIKGLNNTSITQAVELSNQWVRDMNSGKDSSYKRAEDEKGLVPVMVHGEYKWYKLTDQDCLDREGKVMGHCVASYGSSVESGRTVIYSLRDNNNFAHATVEVQNGHLEQVKGKRNAPPVEKYQRATVALLNTLNVPPTGNGMRDIQGMDFLYNASNHKYGTIQDIGKKLYNENNMSVWSLSNDENPDFRIMVGDSVVCSVGPSRYSSGLEYKVNNNAELMKSVTIAGANFSDPMYKLAKFITQVIPQSTHSVDLGELKNYVDFAKEGSTLLTMQEDIGELVFTVGDDVLRLTQPNPNAVKIIQSEAYAHLNKGKVIGSARYNDKEQNIGDRRTIAGEGWHGINPNTLPIIAKYVNTMKQKDRPIIQDDGVYQNPKTFEASTTITNASETIAVSKSGKFGWYKIINSNTDQNNTSQRRGRFSMGDLDASADKATEVLYRYALMNQNQIMVTIGVNADESKHKFDIYHRDSINNLSQADAVEVADVFNKSGLNKYYPFTTSSVVSAFETVGLYFLRESRKFTTDHSVAGEQFQHEDKEFKAIKTHNHLKIYHNGVEVVVFDLNGSEPVTIKKFQLKDRLAMLNNARKIADVLNHYEIMRGDNNDYNVTPDTNKKIAQAGLTYSYDNGWKGMKSGPKPVENTQGLTTSTVGNSEYEIFSFKRDFLVQDANTHELVATLKGFKQVGDPTLIIDYIKMESERESAYDIVADALHDVSQKADITVNLSSSKFDSSTESGKLAKTNFDNKMKARGYTGLSYGGWSKIEDRFPSEVISKGPGGTWVKEAWSASIDPSVRVKQKKANGRVYINRHRDEGGDEERTIKKYHQYASSLDSTTYTLYSRKKPVLRAYVRRGALQIIYKVSEQENDDNEALAIHSKEEFLKHGNAIGRLLHKLEIGGGEYLTDHKLYLVKGKLKDITKNPKLAGFVNGEIVYEDGHKWKQGKLTYRKDEWKLSMPTDTGTEIQLIIAKIDGEGLRSIQFDDPKVRKYTKLYRPFLNDIMDIVDQLYGSD